MRLQGLARMPPTLGPHPNRVFRPIGTSAINSGLLFGAVRQRPLRRQTRPSHSTSEGQRREESEEEEEWTMSNGVYVKMRVVKTKSAASNASAKGKLGTAEAARADADAGANRATLPHAERSAVSGREDVREDVGDQEPVRESSCNPDAFAARQNSWGAILATLKDTQKLSQQTPLGRPRSSEPHHHQLQARDPLLQHQHPERDADRVLVKPPMFNINSPKAETKDQSHSVRKVPASKPIPTDCVPIQTSQIQFPRHLLLGPSIISASAFPLIDKEPCWYDSMDSYYLAWNATWQQSTSVTRTEAITISQLIDHYIKHNIESAKPMDLAAFALPYLAPKQNLAILQGIRPNLIWKLYAAVSRKYPAALRALTRAHWSQLVKVTLGSFLPSRVVVGPSRRSMGISTDLDKAENGVALETDPDSKNGLDSTSSIADIPDSNSILASSALLHGPKTSVPHFLPKLMIDCASQVIRDMKRCNISLNADIFEALYRVQGSVDPRIAIGMHEVARERMARSKLTQVVSAPASTPGRVAWPPSTEATDVSASPSAITESAAMTNATISDSSVAALLAALLYGGATPLPGSAIKIQRAGPILAVRSTAAGGDVTPTLVDIARVTEELWDDMREFNIVPSRRTLLAFMEAFGVFGEKELVEEVHRRLSAAGTEGWGGDVYQVLISAHERVGNWKAVVRVFEDFENSGLPIYGSTLFPTLRALYALEAYLDVIKAFYRNASKIGAARLPDEILELLLQSLVHIRPAKSIACDYIDCVHAFLKESIALDAATKSLVTLRSYISLLESCKSLRLPGQAVRIYTDFKGARIAVYERARTDGTWLALELSFTPRKSVASLLETLSRSGQDGTTLFKEELLKDPSRLRMHWIKIARAHATQHGRLLENARTELHRLPEQRKMHPRFIEAERTVARLRRELQDGVVLRVGKRGVLGVCYEALDRGFRDGLEDRVRKAGGDGIGSGVDRGAFLMTFEQTMRELESLEEDIIAEILMQEGIKCRRRRSGSEEDELQDDDSK